MNDPEIIEASVIIPTRNRADLLKKFVPMLAEQNTSSRFEIIVVENGSTDNTWQVVDELSKKWPKIRLVRVEASGAARARNVGALEARSSILVFVDDDMRADGNLIEQHLKAHADNPGVCVLGNIKTDPGKHPFDRMMGYIYDGLKESMAGREATPLDYWSGNVSLPRDLFNDFDGYDEAFDEIGYAEDLDLGKRLLDRGVKLLFVPEAITFHNFTERFGERLKKSYRTGIAYGYIKDHFPDLPVPDVDSSDSPLKSKMIEHACKIAAALMEPLDRGQGVPIKPLAFVYDLAIRKALGRGLKRYQRGGVSLGGAKKRLIG